VVATLVTIDCNEVKEYHIQFTNQGTPPTENFTFLQCFDLEQYIYLLMLSSFA